MNQERAKTITINFIKRHVQWFHSTYLTTTVFYNNTHITYLSARSFDGSTRRKNDETNKMRENIIGAILNDKIPPVFMRSKRWIALIQAVNDFVLELCSLHGITHQTHTCGHAGGRKNNHDLILTINESRSFNIELKFNAKNVSKTPQFASPMNPSQYICGEISYEKYHYHRYLEQAANEFNLQLPSEETYLSKIHSSSPKCMLEFQTLYYQGCKKSSQYTGDERAIRFYHHMNEISVDGIRNFISANDLNIEKLTKYLMDSQKGKIYMLYKDGKFYLEQIHPENHEIISVEKGKNRYVATTKTGNQLKALLRWKNGNGIAFPAFQISFHPQKKSAICASENVTASALAHSNIQINGEHITELGSVDCVVPEI